MRKSEIGGILVLAAAALVGCSGPAKEPRKDAPAAVAKKAAVYVCPMHPQQTSDKPADCPVCGMKLVLPEQDDAAAKSPTSSSPAGLVPVRVSEESRRQMGLTFGTVERREVKREIRIPARIVPDQARVHRISSPTDGWADKIWANGVGERVKKDGPLIEVYASDWKDLALVAREASSELARERLRRWGISDAQIDKILAGGGNVRALRIFTLSSPADGFIAEKTVLPGQRFNAGDPLFLVADLSQVWAEVDFFESDIPYVKQGMPVSISFPYWPGKEFTGKVALLSPFLDPQTRTLKARIEIPNPKFELRPEMFGTARLAVDLGRPLVVPEGAVMRTGERSYAFRAGEGDRIDPVEVKVGTRADGAWVVLEGLNEGDRVVSSANFLIDSESALKAALQAVTGR